MLISPASNVSVPLDVVKETWLSAPVERAFDAALKNINEELESPPVNDIVQVLEDEFSS